MPRGKASYVLTGAAKADLKAIADYTIATFGVRQARLYRDMLGEAFEFLAQNPLAGRDRSNIRPGYRSHLAGSHVIYYRVRNRSVTLVRVLHGAQNPLHHLGGE